jgi:hypothetical protein
MAEIPKIITPGKTLQTPGGTADTQWSRKWHRMWKDGVTKTSAVDLVALDKKAPIPVADIKGTIDPKGPIKK